MWDASYIMTNIDSIKYHILDMNRVMINMKISLILGLSLLTALGTSNAFAQMPALEEQQQQAPPTQQQQGEEQQPNLSFGKVKIPVSSGEQIILEVPLQDGNSYKLVPIK